MGWDLITYQYQNGAIRLHLIPRDDIKEHSVRMSDEGCLCWCGAEYDDINLKMVVHNSADRREDYEENRCSKN